MLYPLSYGGGPAWSIPALRAEAGFRPTTSGNTKIMSTAKKARHTVDRLAGQAKQKIGRATGDNRLRNEGANDEMKARVKMTGQRLKDAFRGR